MIKYFVKKLNKREKEFIDIVDLQKKEISDAFDYKLPMSLSPSDKLNCEAIMIYKKHFWDYMENLILVLIEEKLKKMGYLEKEKSWKKQ